MAKRFEKAGVQLSAVLAAVALCTAFLLGARPLVAYADECPSGGDHVYSVVIVKYATEDEDGLRRFTCTKCGYTFDQAIPATGHEWGPWTLDVAPTCTSEGSEYRVCTKYPDHPHYEYRLIPPLSPTGEHDFILSGEDAATCTEPGHRYYTCSICGETMAEETPALGHEWGEWTVDAEPTATEDGRRSRTCLHDESHVEYEAIPALGEPEEERSPVQVQSPPPAAKPDQTEEPEEENLFWSGPNAVDAVLLGADFAVLAVFFLLALPLLYRWKWIRGRRAEAVERFKAEAAAQARAQRKGRKRP